MTKTDNKLLLYDDAERQYKHEALHCIMNSTNLKVASQKEGQVAGLRCRIPTQLPCRTTVHTIVDRKLWIAQNIYLRCCRMKNIQLYTSTRQESMEKQCRVTSFQLIRVNILYHWPKREMFNKSENCNRDTFGEILYDISSLNEKRGRC